VEELLLLPPGVQSCRAVLPGRVVGEAAWRERALGRPVVGLLSQHAVGSGFRGVPARPYAMCRSAGCVTPLCKGHGRVSGFRRLGRTPCCAPCVSPSAARRGSVPGKSCRLRQRRCGGGSQRCSSEHAVGGWWSLRLGVLAHVADSCSRVWHRLFQGRWSMWWGPGSSLQDVNRWCAWALRAALQEPACSGSAAVLPALPFPADVTRAPCCRCRAVVWGNCQVFRGTGTSQGCSEQAQRRGDPAACDHAAVAVVRSAAWRAGSECQRVVRGEIRVMLH